ncbi:MAG: hypothetical protein GY858_00310 [Candidatus Omnitrophica bacterium]|nr:hypothetical protein [Candidatus Omnitrophota bacterium]
MRKTLLFFFMICFVALAGYGAPCYGPKMPQSGQWFIGGQTHIIFDRDLESNWGSLRSTQHFLLLSYGVFDWLSIDLKGGGGNIKQHPVDSDELDYPSSFDGGYGLRLKLYDQDDLGIVFGFQHISVHPSSIRVEGVKNQAILDDWQVSLLVSYSFNKIVPYLGVKASRVDYIHWVDEQRKRRMSDLTESIGGFIGCDLLLSDRVWINLEGQFFDGQAACASINFAF